MHKTVRSWNVDLDKMEWDDIPDDVRHIIWDYKEAFEEYEAYLEEEMRFQRFLKTIFFGLLYLVH